MGNRRRARELAMQALFYLDARQESFEVGFPLFCQAHPPSEKAMPFFLRLVNGVVAVRQQIDDIIERYSSHWKVSRMSGVDRNVLRIAVFEMLCCEDIPIKVSINEAIDIGKRFGTDESGAFINGILDSIHEGVKRREVVIDGAIPDPVMPEGAAAKTMAPASRPSTASPVSPVASKGGVLRRRRLGTPEGG